jgi:hypothetical protein
MRPRAARSPLPERTAGAEHTLAAPSAGMTHDELVSALRSIDGLRDVGKVHPNFHFRSRPFLHFHDSADGTYADVRFGSGDFEPVWASTPAERMVLLARVTAHVEQITRSRKDASKQRSRRSTRRTRERQPPGSG